MGPMHIQQHINLVQWLIKFQETVTGAMK